MALMDTTPAPADNAETSPPSTESSPDRLETLASLDPAEAPPEAEELAADLARDLEAVTTDGPSQIATSSRHDDEESR